jgi:hypothetical protein
MEESQYLANVKAATERSIRPPKKRVKLPAQRYEDDEQVELANWLDRHVPPCSWCHVPNEFPNRGHDDWQSAKYAAKLRAKGRKPGVPDCMIFYTPTALKHAGVAVELKRSDGGTVSDDQHAWHASLRALGWYVIVAHGAQEAIQQLQAIGY